MKIRYQITLELVVDLDTSLPPDEWDWPELLDLQADESASVVDCQELNAVPDQN